MNCGKLRVLLAAACLLFGLWLPRAEAGSPSHSSPYYTLGRQEQSSNVQPLHPKGYAYGWFGATARPQAERQTGYYGLYRQWRIK